MAEMEKIMTFTISTTIKEISLNFQTESSLFSPKNIDSGTLAMLSAVDFLPNDKVLDLGCGTGRMTRLLSERGFDMTGVDSSQEMLGIAMDRREAGEEGLRQNL